MKAFPSLVLSGGFEEAKMVNIDADFPLNRPPYKEDYYDDSDSDLEDEEDINENSWATPHPPPFGWEAEITHPRTPPHIPITSDPEEVPVMNIMKQVPVLFSRVFHQPQDG